MTNCKHTPTPQKKDKKRKKKQNGKCTHLCQTLGNIERGMCGDQIFELSENSPFLSCLWLITERRTRAIHIFCDRGDSGVAR